MARRKKEPPVVSQESLSLFDVRPKDGPQNWKEDLYEKVKLPVWVLDVVIAVLVALIVLFIVLGRRAGSV